MALRKPFGAVGLLLSLVLAAPATAQVLRQLTDHNSGGAFLHLGALDDAGTSVFYIAADDPDGINGAGRFQIMRWDASRADVEQVTSLERGVVKMSVGPAVSDDGQWLVFTSTSDPLGTNHDQGNELFAMQADGSGLIQLTDDPSGDTRWIDSYDISGNAAKVVFTSSVDYLGTNPDNVNQAFILERDGTGLLQLTESTTNVWWVTISDDSERIAFTEYDSGYNGNIFKIESDGRRLRDLVDSMGGEFPFISGDGTKVAFHDDADGADEAYVVDWDGRNLIQLTSSYIGASLRGWARYPSLTDDGTWAYYAQKDLFTGGVVRQRSDGTQEEVLADPVAECLGARVSGNGARVRFQCQNGDAFGQGNPDGGLEVYTIEGDGANPEPITDLPTGGSFHPDITPDGSRIVFVSNANLLGGDPDFSGDIYRIEADGTDLFQLTSLDPGTEPTLQEFDEVAGPVLPTVSGDGSVIVFSHNGDPTGGNPDLSRELYAVNDDGSNLRQLTSATASYSECDLAQISADGSVVVFYSTADLLGGGGPGSSGIFKINPDGSGLVQLTVASGGYEPRVNDTGQWVVFRSDWDPFGTNADGRAEVFRIRTDGSSLEQLTNTSVSSISPDISGDGSLVVFQRDDDIFIHDIVSDISTQLTFGADATMPTLSRDGAWAYYGVGPSHDDADLCRVRVSDGLIERVGALDPFEGVDILYWFPIARPYEVDHDGDRLAVGIRGNPADDNFDDDSEIFLVDRSAPPTIEPSSGPAPASVSWTAMSGPVRYDVIRGDVANLDLPGGGISDLGPVVCVDDDSRDTRSQDPAAPLPGQAFFYLFRPINIDGTTGSYGPSSDGSERQPGSGGCSG